MTTNANDYSAKVAEYKYFAVNIVSNEILAEIPFAEVSFERALKGAGSFEGEIAVADATKNLSLYENTMPGKTAIYVLRNGVCVWGGIIWTRDYSITERMISISASEFTSYLQHRNIWKTYNYDLEAYAYKQAAADKVQIKLLTREVTFPTTDNAGNRTKVYVAFNEQAGIKYSGFYEIEASPEPTSVSFYVTIPGLPARPGSYYSKVTISARVDTYQYVRELLTEVFEDFTDVEFANELIEPGVREPYTITHRQIASEVATITTDVPHGIVVGQRVNILNIHPDINGKRVVTETPSATTFTFNTEPGVGDLAYNASALTPAAKPIKYRKVTDISSRAVTRVKRRDKKTVTLTTSGNHGFKVGDLVIVSLKKAYEAYNKNGEAQEIVSVPSATTFTYALDGTNTPSAGIALTGSTVNYTIPRKILQLDLYPGYSHDYAVDDEIYVAGVDDPSWGAPMYEGYHSVTAIGPSDKVIITGLSKAWSTTVVTLTLPAGHGIVAGNTVLVALSDAGTDGTYTVATATATTITYLKSNGTTRSKIAATGSVTNVFARTWVQYDPQFDMTVEPGNAVGITHRRYQYKKTGNKVTTNKVTITTASNHGYVVGDKIYVNTNAAGSDTAFDGDQEISSIPAPNQISYKPRVTGTAKQNLQASSGPVTRTQAIIGPISRDYVTITGLSRTGTTATVTTATDHNIQEGDTVIVNSSSSSYNNGGAPLLVYDVPSSTTFTYYSVGSAGAVSSPTGTVSQAYTNFGAVLYPTVAVVESNGTTRTITCPDHGLKVGDWISVFIKGYETSFNNSNIPVEVKTVSENGLSFTYTASSVAPVTVASVSSDSTVTKSAYISAPPVVYVNSYGEFPNNTDLGGITFSTSNYSQKSLMNTPIRGGELLNVGEHLDKYSNSVNGFDYRIDCSLDTSSGVGVFKRQFSIVPRIPAELTDYLNNYELAAGEYAPPSAFGADRLTFEYPGNVSDVSLQENAENSVTRMFVTGDGKGSGGGDASPRYSAAASTDLLASGWPILDGSEKQEWPLYGYDKINVDNWGNYDVEGDLHKSAQRFLSESRPPMGEYSISVNGSLDPVVGTYNPGDWCQVVINDDFISERLNSDLEPRNDVILRKIESIKVSVPNSPAFPEEITLNLVPEWEVDKRG